MLTDKKYSDTEHAAARSALYESFLDKLDATFESNKAEYRKIRTEFAKWKKRGRPVSTGLLDQLREKAEKLDQMEQIQSIQEKENV